MLTHHLTRALTQAKKLAGRTWRPPANRPKMVSAHTLPEEQFLACFNLPGVTAALTRNDSPAARQALLDHFSQRTAPAWPDWPPTVLYKGRHASRLSRAELLAEAELLLQHRLTLGSGLEVDLGERLDWSYDPTGDPRQRWRRDLHRHLWWPVLAEAYAQTGDERYAAGFVELLLSWIGQNPPPPAREEDNPVWSLMGVGLRCLAWTTTLARFWPSPCFSAEAKLAMLASLYDHGRFLYLFKTSRNHLIRESNGLAYLSLYFPEFGEAAEWRRAALDRLDTALAEQLNPDGSQIELSTAYQWLVIDEFENTHRLLEAHGLSLPREDLPARLEKMYTVLAYLLRPEGLFPDLNDGFMEDSAPLLARLAEAGRSRSRPDLVYIGSRGDQGEPPPAASIAFPDAGWLVMRSDWSRQARYLLLDTGPYGGPHGHEDKLSLELSAFGQPFLVDAGSYTYNKVDPFRAYFMGSQGHNTVLVDGFGQARRWRRENLRPRPGQGEHATWLSEPGFDYAAATYAGGYGPFSLEPPEEAAPVRVTHTRRVLFVKPDYWLVIDDLDGEAPHDYQLLFHAWPGLEVVTLPRQATLLRAASGAALLIVPAEPGRLSRSCQVGREAPIQGWHSARGGQKTPAPAILYQQTGRRSARFVTLLYPLPAGASVPVASVELLPVSGGPGLAAAVTTEQGRDYLLISDDEGGLRRFGPYQTTGCVAGARTDRQGTLVSRFEGRCGK